jgi:NitT/TauT family transport system substrate-binding protein
MRARRWTVGAAMVALVFAAGASPASAQTKEVRIALPFPNGAAWPYFSVAEEMGYARDEGVSFRLIQTDGSAAAYKVMATKDADIAFAQPAQVLNGLALGHDVVSIYTAYQGHVYQFAAPESSPYKRVADLKGNKIGISSVAGGQYAYLLATLKNAGLTVGPGKDVEIAEVGRGGAATIALRDKRIAAYSASFVDIMQIKLNGEKVRLFKEGPTATFFSDSITVLRANLEKDPKPLIGTSRAIARATLFCFENKDACWNMIVKHVPDTAKRPEFTKPLLAEVLELHQLPEEAKGRWGYQSAAAWAAVQDFLIESEQLKQKVDVSRAFTNGYIAEINNFDAAKVKQQAAAAK